MKRMPKRICLVSASIVIAALLIGGVVAILMKIENSKYDAHVESAHAQIERALTSDPNYAMIKVSVETFSVQRDMLPMYRRTIGRIPVVNRLGFLKNPKPTKGIVLRGGGNGFDPGSFYEKVIRPLEIDVPLQIKFSVSK